MRHHVDLVYRSSDDVTVALETTRLTAAHRPN
jgi:hypothetical protein